MSLKTVKEAEGTRQDEGRRPIHLASQSEEDFARVLGAHVRAYCGVWCRMPAEGLRYVKEHGPKAKVCPACRALADAAKS